MSKVKLWFAFCSIALLALVGCGGSPGEATDEVGVSTAELAPAGSNAKYLANTMKATWYPGERGIISITMQNTGTLGAVNDWSPTSPTFALGSLDYQWFWASTAVATTVHVSNAYTFSLSIAAPSTPGSYVFKARMRAMGFGDFGDTVSIPVTVSTAAAREWACTYVPGSSNLPTSMTPSENRQVTVTVQNIGTDTWVNGFILASQDVPTNLWGQTIVQLGGNLASGGTKTWTFGIRSPSTPGIYHFTREMRDTRTGGVGVFQRSNFCIDVPINVAGTSVLDASLGTQNFPTTMAPGEPATVTVAMDNTGTEAWQANGTYALASVASPSNTWGITWAAVKSLTNSGGTANITFNITAPTAPGSYSQKWQMVKYGSTNAGYYGAVVNVPVTVSSSATPQYGATVVSQTLPSLMTVGKSYSFSIAMQNSGTASWSGTSFGLASVNSPKNLWLGTMTPLGASETVASGGSRTFAVTAKAPPTAGTYASNWRMSGTAGLFGQTATTSALVVTLCGNSAIDAGETCDDGNLVNGDGCSDHCQTE